MENENGLIYILTNPYFEGMVKIGMTRRTDIRKRIKELGTAVPEPFVCTFAYLVPMNRLSAIESLLHDNYSDRRVGNSEFFRVDPARVDKLMRELGNFQPMQDEVQMEIDIEEGKRTRRKNMDFFELGLHVGDTLAYARDNNIRCTISSRKTVDFGSQLNVSLSRITRDLLGYPVQPSLFWVTADGVLLNELQNKLYASDAIKSAADASAHAQCTADHAAELSTICQQLKMQL